MSAPLTVFLQGLRSLESSPDSLAEVHVVQDNCGKLSDSAQAFLRLCYKDSNCKEGCSRWDTHEVCEKHSQAKISRYFSNMTPHRPCRRDSLEPGADKWTKRNSASVDKTPHMPPRDATERASLRWAVALDSKRWLMDKEEEEENDDEDDSSTDSETESSFSDSDFDFGAYEIESDSDDEDCDDDESFSCDGDCEDICGSNCENRLASKMANAHDWRFPPNAILPNMQEIFRKAAQNRDYDINKTVQSLSLNSPGQLLV